MDHPSDRTSLVVGLEYLAEIVTIAIGGLAMSLHPDIHEMTGEVVP